MRLFDVYYQIKPLIPRGLQVSLRRRLAERKRRSSADSWPIDRRTDKRPDGWRGWPDHKDFAFVLQHDVDTLKGLKSCPDLMELEMRLGFRSFFSFVPEDYSTPADLRRRLRESDFEVGVHGLKHDGKLFRTPRGFFQRAPFINRYLRDWEAVGFTSPSMLRNLALMAELDIEHGCSTFDTDPFEPQSDGAGTIFPFYASNVSKTRRYVEHPYTLPQDHCLFVILGEKDIKIWKEKVDWIAEQGGMAYLNTHPDYMNFHKATCSLEEYPVRFYSDFLQYVRTRYSGRYWHPLPRDLARFWVEAMPPEDQLEGAA